jgi:catechol 2,3-dioxygenase-like lactoylglutathione lyase family enzyme
MPLTRLDHFSVRTADVEGTKAFYETVLGLRNGERPQFPFPGAWLYQGDRAVVHIIGIDPKDPSGLQEYLGDRGGNGQGTGSFDHIAFVATDFEGMRKHFTELGVPFRHRSVPGLALEQLFVTDPNGITVEINFPS